MFDSEVLLVKYLLQVLKAQILIQQNKSKEETEKYVLNLEKM